MPQIFFKCAFLVVCRRKYLLREHRASARGQQAEHLLAVLHLAELAGKAFLFSVGSPLGFCSQVAASFSICAAEMSAVAESLEEI